MMADDPNLHRDSSDEHLRELFSVLRKEEMPRTPPFIPGPKIESVRQRRPAKWRPGLRFAATVCAATLLAALLWLRHDLPRRRASPGQGSYAPVASITEWRPPTDFLLNTPGREMMRTVPVLTPEPYPNRAGSPPNRKPEPPQAPTPLSQ